MASRSISSRRMRVVPEDNRCDDCGNHAVDDAIVEGVQVRQCRMCGALSGDDDAVSRVILIREARDAGCDPEVWPLVCALKGLRGVGVVSSSAGDGFMRVPPFVQFKLADSRLVQLDNVMHSIELARRTMKHHWQIKVGLNQGLYFELSPSIAAADIDDETVDWAHRDAATLAAALVRDSALSWWRR